MFIRRVSFGAVTTIDEDLPRIQKPQKRIAFNAIAGIKNHIISHNLKATPIPAKQLETLHMPDLVQLKEKKRKNKKNDLPKPENDSKTENVDDQDGATSDVSEISKNSEVSNISKASEISKQSETSSKKSETTSLPSSRLPSDDIVEDANFVNQDPELLSNIFFKKALAQPNRSKQLAEICKKLSTKVDGFLPCLLRQLQKQYSEEG